MSSNLPEGVGPASREVYGDEEGVQIEQQCPTCDYEGTMGAIPRGHSLLMVTCPKCWDDFEVEEIPEPSGR